MEIDGHPTQDILDELQRRGALPAPGTSAGPSPDALSFIAERHPDGSGFWLFLPFEAFETGFDEIPG
jgi:hypothetical protein